MAASCEEKREISSPEPGDGTNNERDVGNKWGGSIPGLTRVHDTSMRKPLVNLEEKIKKRYSYQNRDFIHRD